MENENVVVIKFYPSLASEMQKKEIPSLKSA